MEGSGPASGEEARLSENLRDLRLSTEVCEKVHCTFCARREFFRRAAARAYTLESGAQRFAICRYAPLERLVILCVLLTDVRTQYASLRIPQDVYLDTISDIALHQRLYYETTGKLGLSMDDAQWLSHIFRMRIFKLGALQFQLAEMAYPSDPMRYDPAFMRQLPQGTPVLQIHIQRGADLSPLRVDDALQRARAFFSRYFPAHSHAARAFVCCSWLLYPEMRRLLPPESNILHFSKRFTIIGTSDDGAGAIRRIYGKIYRRRSEYPQDTRLQRAALGHFSMLGGACGIIPI